MRITAWSLIIVLLLSIAPAASAKPQGDWTSVKNSMGQRIALQTKDGETVYGILLFANDSEIQVLVAGDRQFTGQEASFGRDKVEKVWRATLRFGDTKVGRGALIGLGAGFGAAFVTALALAAGNSSDPAPGLGLFPVIGVGVGSLIGATKPKGHKKQKLIYSI